jgi:asparagine synthetase B (glutamine-hydrolysing)
LCTYWDGADIPPKETITDAVGAQAYEAFKKAVHVRLSHKRQAIAFLSGGLPFFDSDFLEHMYALPVDEMVNHKFYMQWFSLFPENAHKTPWQTYPGHENARLNFQVT